MKQRNNRTVGPKKFWREIVELALLIVVIALVRSYG